MMSEQERQNSETTEVNSFENNSSEKPTSKNNSNRIYIFLWVAFACILGLTFSGDLIHRRIENKGWTIFSEHDTEHLDYVITLEVEPNGVMWIGDHQGLYHIEPENWTLFSELSYYPNDNFIRDIEVAPDGQTWIFFDGGFAFYDGKDLNIYETGRLIKEIAVGMDGIVWVITKENRVLSYNGKKWTDHSKGIRNLIIYSIAIDPNGKILIGTKFGAFQFDGESWHTFPLAKGLSDMKVFEVAFANDGTLWFGTDEGVQHFDGKTWSIYDSSNGLVGNEVTIIEPSPDGAIWFGLVGDSSGKGLSRFYNDNWTTFYPPVSSKGYLEISDIVADKYSNVWVNTHSYPDSYLFYLEPKKAETVLKYSSFIEKWANWRLVAIGIASLILVTISGTWISRRQKKISAGTVQESKTEHLIKFLLFLIVWAIAGSAGAFGGFFFGEFITDLSKYTLYSVVVGVFWMFALGTGAIVGLIVGALANKFLGKGNYIKYAKVMSTALATSSGFLIGLIMWLLMLI